jgi:hypothetical protein
MYGVPPSLDLADFVGATLIQVALGEYEVELRFSPTGTIAIEGEWELRNSDGSVADRAMPNPEREAYFVHHLLGQRVAPLQSMPHVRYR